MTSSIRIGPAVVVPAARQLFVSGVQQPLGGRAFDLLMALVHHAGEVVSKDALVEWVWPDVAVEPNNLHVQVWALRRALGEDAIVTVPRRGYRLALAVEGPRVDERPVDRRGLHGDLSTAAHAPATHAFVAAALDRLRAAGVVTVVADEAATRRAAVAAVREAYIAATRAAAWRWTSCAGDGGGGLAPLRRALGAGGLLVFEELHEQGSSRLLQLLRSLESGAVRVLASSADVPAVFAQTVVEVPTLQAVARVAAQPDEPLLRWRPRASPSFAG